MPKRRAFADLFLPKKPSAGINKKLYVKKCRMEHKIQKDILTEYPLSFSEFYDAFEGDKRDAWQEYYTYSGMPMTLSLDSHERKSRYLRDLFERTYIRDNLAKRSAGINEKISNILVRMCSLSNRIC